MDKKAKIYLVVFVVFIGLFIYYESVKPKPINWFPSYAAHHKIPYGTFVLREELADLFPQTEITTIKIPPYIYLQDSTRTGTYVFIDEGFNIGEEELNELLAFVERGNDVFISTHGITIDSIKVSVRPIFSTSLEEKPFFKLMNKNLSTKEYSFDRAFSNTSFYEIDTLSTIALGKTGYTNSNDERIAEGINFIKQPFGKGNFYFHTFPEAFTNYFILKKGNQQYTASVLSYLDSSKPILWDAYYKTGKKTISSPMHYLLSTKSLRWAYYLTLIGVLLFVIFEGKRKQRNIPIITPLKNQTLAFTRTIANMYYEKSEHKSIAEQKITYLLEFIRTKFHVPTVKVDADFYKQVAARSSNSIEKVESLFNYIDFVHRSNQITEEQLTKLENLINEFKNPL